MFRWLCQLRVAPYSYDLIDNLGRRSPRELVPGLDDLAVGQPFVKIFTLVAFAPDRELTLRLTDRVARLLFGDLAITYRVSPRPAGGEAGRGGDPCPTRGGGCSRGATWAMMHRQLRTLATLAAA